MTGKGILRNRVLVLAIITAPFFINDFFNIFVKDFTDWILLDYVFAKALPLVFIAYLFKKGLITYDDLGIKKINITAFVFFSIVMSGLGVLTDQPVFDFLSKIFPETKVGGIPIDEESFLYTFDLYFGLAYVAIVEEVIFRGLAFTVLKERLNSIFAVFVVSSFIFGMVHWSLGLTAIVSTAVIGAMFMVVMWRTGSVLPTIAAHFVVNYIAFS